jgi:hypothetical protein
VNKLGKFEQWNAVIGQKLLYCEGVVSWRIVLMKTHEFWPFLPRSISELGQDLQIVRLINRLTLGSTVSLIFSTFSSVIDVEGCSRTFVVFHFLPTFHEPFVSFRNSRA